MIYFVMACAITSWIMAVLSMVNDPDWDYTPDEYSEGDNEY